MEVMNSIPKLENTAVALGYFDGLHKGHNAVIKSAFECEGQKVVLSVGRAYQKKSAVDGSRIDSALILHDERDEVLEQLQTDVLIMPPFEEIREMSGEQFVEEILSKRLGAKRVACGYNYAFGKDASCGAEQLRQMCAERGIECVTVPEVDIDGETVSSSAIREALGEGDTEKATRLLGRQYGYRLTVSGGQRLGRTLGAPTLNQIFPEWLILPRFGVYASVAYVGGEAMYAVTNIGVRPTVGTSMPLSETWIPEYTGEDLYGCDIRIEPVSFIRAEQRFESIEELREAIHRDAKRAKELAAKYIKNVD